MTARQRRRTVCFTPAEPGMFAVRSLRQRHGTRSRALSTANRLARENLNHVRRSETAVRY